MGGGATGRVRRGGAALNRPLFMHGGLTATPRLQGHHPYKALFLQTAVYTWQQYFQGWFLGRPFGRGKGTTLWVVSLHSALHCLSSDV